ncbi:MAG: (5-formylfuran-3-yl)methyl phosphate synthase [Bdellovibrio sp.]|nr:(5-formylfuran-3-yl)methyl phosphate synthase [Methylotenera sp.]
MTQLLISVKNVEEALLALACGADIIDLKDPTVGALGALDMPTSLAILAAVNKHASHQETRLIASQTTGPISGPIISTTVGENHATLKALIAAIQERAALGHVIIKIAVSDLFDNVNFLAQMRQLTNTGVKIVAVFFADERLDLRIDLTVLPTLKQAGFYGAMLDTKNKHKNLTQTQTKEGLGSFTHFCHQQHLKSGLAGSLQSQHIDMLSTFNATYMGFRGGVCDDFERKGDLSATKILEVKKLLLAHNKYSIEAQKIIPLALHS